MVIWSYAENLPVYIWVYHRGMWSGRLNRDYLHCKIKRVDLAAKMGPKRVSPVWHSLRVNSAPLKWGCFWHQFWGWIDPVVGAKLDHVKGEFEKYRGHFEIYRGQNSPRNFSPLTNGPFKKSQFSSNVGHFRSRGLFPLHADFPPYIQIMKIHHILYLSNTHLLGSRWYKTDKLWNIMWNNITYIHI